MPVFRDFLMGLESVLVINDEGHHCYREKPGPDDDEDLKGYKTLCVEDATWTARESTRKKGILDSHFTYLKTAKEATALLSR